MKKKLPNQKRKLAKDLVKNHGFTQEAVAKLMEVTQSTISKAVNETKVNNKKENNNKKPIRQLKLDRY